MKKHVRLFAALAIALALLQQAESRFPLAGIAPLPFMPAHCPGIPAVAPFGPLPV